MLCTVEEIREYLEAHLSEKRFSHCKGTAWMMGRLFGKFGLPQDVPVTYNGMDVASVVGLMHDVSREYPDAELLSYVREHGYKTTVEELEFPVLLHGMVSAGVTRELLGASVPEAWLKAMECHTTGSIDMGYVGAALFVADYLEPTRTFLDDEKRRQYLDHDDLSQVASAVLDDMVAHWATKGITPSASSLELQKFFHGGNKIH